jgi:gliding motility-associated-like protein
LRAEQEFYAYNWSDGSIGQSLVVTQPGEYHLRGQNANGCESRGEIKVSFIDAPVVNLGKDTLACEPYPLNAKGENSGNLVFQWSNGTMDSVLLPPTSGVYWVTVKNQCGQSSDTITIKSFQDIFVPNVVTPNNDGLNDQLRIEWFDARPLPSMTIYDSWGLQIYSKDNYDGDWPDHRTLHGVYFFSVNHSDCRARKGWVQVLK